MITTLIGLAERAGRFALRWLSRTVNDVRLRQQPVHRRRIRRSRAVLRELRAMRGEAAAARAFGYLRKVDPLVCEEVVLSALEDAGVFVLRNKRYTGDGGIDGRCWLLGAGWRMHVVQIKRYDAAITPSHVADFAQLVRHGRWAGGLFVHCGRTGPMSYLALRGTDLVLVSGDVLLRLLITGQLPQVGGMSRSASRTPAANGFCPRTPSSLKSSSAASGTTQSGK